nr:uncharacterized protein LOC129434227 [Misgurnus anguillicaudatus]
MTLMYYVTLSMRGYHWDFDNIINGENGTFFSDISKLKPGDLILRAAKDKVGKLIYHAGVNTEDNEVIHFTSDTDEVHSIFSWSASSKGKGKISKESVMSFVNDQPYCVLRLKSGIPKDFKDRVKSAMHSKQEYHLFTNNCLHFALRLLGVQQQDNNNFMDRKAKIIIEEYMGSAAYTNLLWKNDNSLSSLIMNGVHHGAVSNMMTQTTSISAIKSLALAVAQHHYF